MAGKVFGKFCCDDPVAPMCRFHGDDSTRKQAMNELGCCAKCPVSCNSKQPCRKTGEFINPHNLLKQRH